MALTAHGRYALLKSRQDGKTHRLSEGAQIAGWTLAEVKRDSVTLSKGDDVKSLPLLRAPAPVSVVARQEQIEALLKQLRARVPSEDAAAAVPQLEAPPDAQGEPLAEEGVSKARSRRRMDPR